MALIDQHKMANQAQRTGKANHQGKVRVNCPFCLERVGKADRRSSLIYYRYSGYYKCFKCAIQGVDIMGAGPMPDVGPSARCFEHTQGPEGFMPLWEPTYSPLLEPAIEYLERRKINIDIRRRALLGACLSGRFAHRIIAPHLDPDGTWWGWSGRTWLSNPELRKYDYPSDMSREKLYNGHALQVETDKPVMVVEGVFDSLLYLPDVVACLGKPTDKHKEQFRDARRPIAFCFDADFHRGALGLAMALQLEGRRAGCVRLPPGQDPNSVNPLWLRAQADNCIGGLM